MNQLTLSGVLDSHPGSRRARAGGPASLPGHPVVEGAEGERARLGERDGMYLEALTHQDRQGRAASTRAPLARAGRSEPGGLPFTTTAGLHGRLLDWAQTLLRTTLHIVRKPADQRGCRLWA